MATCSRCPSPVAARRYSAPRMVTAIVMPVPVSPSDRPGFTGIRPFSPVTLIVPRVAFAQAAAGITNARVFDLHHLGTEPRQGFGAGRPRFELGEIDDAHTREK